MLDGVFELPSESDVFAWAERHKLSVRQQRYEKSQKLVYDAWELVGYDQLALARRALELCPVNPDAWGILGKQVEARDDPLKAAVELASFRVWAAKVMFGEPGKKSDLSVTASLFLKPDDRPFTRAVATLADALWKAGRAEEAAVEWRRLMRQDKRDGGGFRYLLSFHYTSSGQWEKARRVLPPGSDDVSGWFQHQKALLSFVAQSRSMDNDARAAIASNPHIVGLMPLLLDFDIIEPDGYAHGGYYEAVFYIQRARAGWLVDPAALQWLYQVEHALDRERREARRQKAFSEW